MSQDSLKQASVRAVTGTANSYEGDWHALFDAAGLPAGMFDERLLRWINRQMAASYVSLPEAMQAYAASFGAHNWSSLGTFTITATETDAIVAAMTTPPTPARKLLIDITVRSLKVAGVWTKLDGFGMLAAADSQAALLNWSAPATPLVVHGSPVFAADRGYTGDASAAYLDTALNTSTTTNAKQNSHSMGEASRTNSSVTGADIGTSELSLNPKDTTPNFTARSASTTANGDTNSGTSIGHFSLSRTAGATYNKYRDGALLATKTQASAAFTSQNVFLLARNGGAGTPAGFTARQLSHWFLGAGLSDTEVAALYAAASNYLTTVGA